MSLVPEEFWDDGSIYQEQERQERVRRWHEHLAMVSKTLGVPRREAIRPALEMWKRNEMSRNPRY